MFYVIGKLRRDGCFNEYHVGHFANRCWSSSVTVQPSALKAEIKPQMRNSDSLVLSCVFGPRCQGDKLEWEWRAKSCEHWGPLKELSLPVSTLPDACVCVCARISVFHCLSCLPCCLLENCWQKIFLKTDSIYGLMKHCRKTHKSIKQVGLHDELHCDLWSWR